MSKLEPKSKKKPLKTKPLFQLPKQPPKKEKEKSDLKPDADSGQKENKYSSMPPRPSLDLPPLKRAKSQKITERKSSNLFAPPPSKRSKDDNGDAPTDTESSNKDQEDRSRAQDEKGVKPNEKDPPSGGETQAILMNTTFATMLTKDISSTIEVDELTKDDAKDAKKNGLDTLVVFLRAALSRIRDRLPSRDDLLLIVKKVRKNLEVPLFSEDFKNKKLPPNLPKPLKTIANHAQRLHIAIAVLGFVVVLVGIGLSGENDTTQSTTLVGKRISIVQADPAGVKAATPLSAYPSFPWKDHLETLLENSGKSGISEIFERGPKAIAAAMTDLSPWGPTGYDLLPDATTLEIFPGPHENAHSPRFVFLFIDNKLFEIELRYGATVAEKLKDDAFQQFSSPASSNGTDPTGRDFVKHLDQDVVIEQLRKKDKYGRVFRSLVFSHQDTIASLGKKEQRRKSAMASLTQGMNHFNEKDFDAAIAKFRAARKTIPSFGQAFIMEAISFLRKQDFARAEFLAHTALDKTQNKRIKADANGVKAVTNLYKGRKAKALAFWKEAIRQDSANSALVMYKDELETGQYSAERVAKTAARIDCLEESNTTTDNSKQRSRHRALLARGNFPDESTYAEALKLAENDPDFSKNVKKWRLWECQ